MASVATGFAAVIEPWAPHWRAALAAAANATDPEPLIRPLIGELGFNGLTFVVLSPMTAGRERALHCWSTGPAAWAQRYCERAYASVDPRVTLTARRQSPVIWDAADFGGWQAKRFLTDAARYGTRSGFAVAFRDATHARSVVGLDSAASPLSESRCSELAARLGDLMLFAAALYERVLRPRFGPGAETLDPQAGLTPREHECLAMTANGQTSGDIGSKLGIAERTVNFHMRNVLRKLGALNRPEAIAKALARGMLEATPLAQRSR